MDAPAYPPAAYLLLIVRPLALCLFSGRGPLPILRPVILLVKYSFEYLTSDGPGRIMGCMADRAAKDALYEGFAEVARALASGRRAEIADLLAQGERPVEQITDEIGQSVANTSHHLRAMVRAGLVTTRRDGTHIYYALASDPPPALSPPLHQVP